MLQKKRHTIFIFFLFQGVFYLIICTYMLHIACVQYVNIYCTVLGFALFQIQCWSKTSYKNVRCCIWRKIFFQSLSVLKIWSKYDRFELNNARWRNSGKYGCWLIGWKVFLSKRSNSHIITTILDQGFKKPGGQRPT